ncbi:MAG: glycoside hydrolase, partial [Planctomycetes bacterium]|nr:glycoside hydrolase [Planctomycetota bacterium]
MALSSRYLMVHGHFYQPPRENPWTGTIDPQHSAFPWENWNSRIADECYIPMARARVFNPRGEVADLYNNYAHTSFNFGPTLLSWLDEHHPRLLTDLCDAVAIDRTYAMAQAYSHMILPLADARDRHTQIIWGLKEFFHRFGFLPHGMWLPECAVDRETMRALVDHQVRFVILSPHQASSIRPFGAVPWQDASMGSIDTRRAYRVFDIDGGGRTHFDRYLDV